MRFRVVASLVMGCAAWTATAQPAATPSGLYFRDACATGDRLAVAAVGDLLFHFNLQRQALAPGSNYARFFDEIGHVFERADIVYGNLEGPAARAVSAGGREARNAPKASERSYDRRFYSSGEDGVLVFNFHPSVVADLKASGFSVVSTANNHAADRGGLGIERTIDELEAVNLKFTGTRRRHESEFDRPWSTVTRAKGFNIAWLACSYDLNGMPDPHAQALVCYDRRGATRADVLDEIRRLAADPSIDAVILTPHWGSEYTHRPAARERRLAREAIEAGATAVIGSHPHVLQPWEQHVTEDGREGLIIYSMGNFISSQVHVERRTGLIALLEFVRSDGGKARLAAAGYVPTWVRFGAAWRVVENNGEANAQALRQTLRLLPSENRMLTSEMDQLPKDCGPGAVARRTPATDATASQRPAQTARASEVTGSIARSATEHASTSKRSKRRTKSRDAEPMNPWLWWWRPQR